MKSPELSPVEFQPYTSPEQWLAQYVVGSFYFSQGAPDVQDTIDTISIHACMNDGQREWVEENISSVEVLRISTAAIEGFFATQSVSHQNVSGNAIYSEVQERLSRISKLFRIDIEPLDLPFLVENFVDQMTLKDTYLLIGYGDGADPIRKEVGHSRFGRSLSIEHLVDQTDTGHPVFNHLFQLAWQRLLFSKRIEFLVDRLQRLEDESATLRGNEPRTINDLLEYAEDAST